MLAYTLRWILATLPVMGMIALFVFILVRVAPGDPAAITAGDYATPEAIQRIHKLLSRWRIYALCQCQQRAHVL
jgi:peptide/nickel transport system permease protein